MLITGLIMAAGSVQLVNQGILAGQKYLIVHKDNK